MIPKLKLALCQISVGVDKNLNISRACAAISNAQQMGSNLVVLPECWNCPYSTASFPHYAEVIPKSSVSVDSVLSPSVSMLCTQAKIFGIWLIGGSVPELFVGEDNQPNKYYNTCVIVNPEGEIVAKHRKMHLFDIDVPGLLLLN
jgi:omega-amidase